MVDNIIINAAMQLDSLNWMEFFVLKQRQRTSLKALKDVFAPLRTDFCKSFVKQHRTLRLTTGL